MEFSRDKIKSLSKMNVCAEQAELGELLLYILDNMSVLNNTNETASNDKECQKIKHIDETDATTIKQLVSDYNKLIGALKSSGIME